MLRSLLTRAAKLAAHPHAPYAALAVGLVVLLGAAASTFGLPRTLLPPSFVVFDPVKFANAQRAAASILVVNPSAETAFSLTMVAKQAESVIAEEAHGAVVLVRQAVITPEGIPDITDAVLTRFGLPTQVPTVSSAVGGTLESVAPTDSTFSAGKLREDYRLEIEQRAGSLAESLSRKDAQEKTVP